MGGGGQRGKNWDNCIRITIKKKMTRSVLSTVYGIEGLNKY